ncbi:MAG: RIP metalloprotease RseP [Patescibacteria group bacterium]
MLLTIIVFIAILAVLVLAHELGHFFTARKLGVNVEEFGFGFPPRVLSVKKNNTTYSLNLLPLGGFVKLKGENGEGKQDADSFAAQLAWKRSVILVAGVFMNVVLCFVLLSVGFMSGLPTIVDESNVTAARDVKVQIFSVLPQSPAAKAGIGIGDSIISLDGVKFDSLEQVQNYIAEHNNIALSVKLEQNGAPVEKQVIPMVLPESNNKAAMGVTLIQTGIISYPWYESIWMGGKSTGYLIYDTVAGFVMIIKNLISEHKTGVEVAGPVGIAVLTGQVVSLGWIYVLQFAALLSINLAIINILPIPALDGGRILFVIIEKIRRKANSEKIEALVHQIGFMFLMLLIVVVTYKDLMRFGDKILNAISKLW